MTQFALSRKSDSQEFGMEAQIKVCRWIVLVVTAALPLLFVGCGGSGSSMGSQNQSPNGNLAILMQDSSREDWATIGVKVTSISLAPQGSGSPVTMFTAAAPAPMIDLVQFGPAG
jgi:hypothetical protein